MAGRVGRGKEIEVENKDLFKDYIHPEEMSRNYL